MTSLDRWAYGSDVEIETLIRGSPQPRWDDWANQTSATLTSQAAVITPAALLIVSRSKSEPRDNTTTHIATTRTRPPTAGTPAHPGWCASPFIPTACQGQRAINPTERTPNRRLRRYLEQRDGGCTYPLCLQRRWLHAHHLWHWEDGGPTTAWNLLCLCPLHHRAVHHGEITVEGDPEQGTIVFRDKWGQAIGPPDLGPDQVPPPTQPLELTYLPPTGERFETRWFAWN